MGVLVVFPGGCSTADRVAREKTTVTRVLAGMLATWAGSGPLLVRQIFCLASVLILRNQSLQSDPSGPHLFTP